ncbi:MAG: energy transducer TonB [Bacteroidota bacterium]
MKLDILKSQWLELVFDGRNKVYGAYELRKTNPKTTLRALLFGSLFFGFAVAAPLIIRMIPDSSGDDSTLDTKITTIKLPPKQEKPKENLPPPPPPPPKVDVVKFVKPVVAKAEEVTEEPPKIVDLKDKNIGKENIKGDPDAPPSIEPPGNGPADVVEDNTIYNSAGISVKPDFPGGVDKFRAFISNNFNPPDADSGAKSGTVYIQFVVEKDGSITDIKAVRDIGYGSGKEGERVVKKMTTKWSPGEQNGKKVRCTFLIPIKVVISE